MDLEEKVVKAQITGKFNRTNGLMFWRKEYFIDYQVVDIENSSVINGEKR